MTIQYQLTFEDFQEAVAAQRRFDCNLRATYRSLVWLVIFVVAVLYASNLLNAEPGMPPPTWVQRVSEQICLLVPWLTVVAGLGLFLRRMSRPPMPRQLAQRRGEVWRKLPWIVVVTVLCSIVGGVMVVALTAPRRPLSPGSVPPPSLERALLPLLPWFAILTVVWITVFRVLRGMRRRIWQSQPTLHRMHTVESGEKGLVVSDLTARHELSWAHFTRAVETANLFLLFISDYSFYMVPKRAFVSEDDVAMFRILLQGKCAAWESLAGPSGFPVLPVVTSPPARPSRTAADGGS